MYNLIEVPTPPDSHYVGIIYLYEEDGVEHLISVKDRDKFQGHINSKLPGGSSETINEEYVPYENYLFQILERLKFERRALVKILKNERRKKQLFEDYPENNEIGYITRTMVLECLKKIGYYPLDDEPKVVHVLEKDGHTQYFVEIKNLLDSKGDIIEKPDTKEGFRALDMDIRETRVPVPISKYKSLILSHGTAVQKYLIATGRPITSDSEFESEFDADD